MKRFILPLLLSFLFCIIFPVASFAVSNRSITILYTGFVNGSIAPCKVCGKNNMGGLARRAHMIESIRRSEQATLLLDCGAVFDLQKDKAELHLKAMGLMGYDALNLGSSEFHFGKEFLEQSRSHVSFPYIASNLLYGGSRLPWTQEDVIKEVGGTKVAILGILNPEDFAKLPDQEQVKGLEVIPPEAALNRLLPEVRAKADMVILLSQFDLEKTRELVQAVKGIDIAVLSAVYDMVYPKPPDGTLILQIGILGKTLGLLKISLDEKRVLSVIENRHVLLGNSVPVNEEIEKIVEKYEKAEATKKAEQNEKAQKELKDGLQLSPREYMDRHRGEFFF